MARNEGQGGYDQANRFLPRGRFLIGARCAGLDWTSKSDRARFRVERAIIVCLAGPIAQRRFNPRSWRSHHGASDFSTAVDLAMRMCGSEKESNAFLAGLEARAENEVALHWREIGSAAALLIERRTLKGFTLPDIYKALGVTVKPSAQENWP